MVSKKTKVLIVIFSVLSIIISSVSALVFLFTHMTIGLILAIVALVPVIIGIILGVASKQKSFKIYILPIISCLAAIGVLIFTIIGMGNVRNMENQIGSGFDDILHDNPEKSYLGRTKEIQRALDAQDAIKKYEKTAEKARAANEKLYGYSEF